MTKVLDSLASKPQPQDQPPNSDKPKKANLHPSVAEDTHATMHHVLPGQLTMSPLAFSNKQ